MPILTKVDKAVDWFERLDSPKAKMIFLIFLIFACLYFGVIAPCIKGN
jgi:hypothetical protein